jgi:hypothetical protein
MVDWQITAATFRCNILDDEITLLVNKDWSVKCTGHMKLTSKGKKNGHNPGCSGPDCKLAADYLKKLQAEEAGTAE